jgi:hypothetical protein
VDYRITTTADGRITLLSGDNPSRVTGLDALIQEILIELLSNQIPSRGRGAGVLASADNFVFNDSALISDLRQSVSTAQSHIIANQQSATTLKADERLASLTFLSAKVSDGAWSLNVRVTNRANQTREVAVPVGI